MNESQLRRKLQQSDLSDAEVEDRIDRWADDARQEAKDKEFDYSYPWPFPKPKLPKL